MSKAAAEDFSAKPLAERRELCQLIKTKHPGRVPIILNAQHYRGELEADYKWKYLCPEHYLLSQLYWEIIQKGMKVSFKESVHFHFYNSLMQPIVPQMSCTLLEAYNKYRSNDGFLYIYVSRENTFG
jgi:hypothetical protein